MELRQDAPAEKPLAAPPARSVNGFGSNFCHHVYRGCMPTPLKVLSVFAWLTVAACGGSGGLPAQATQPSPTTTARATSLPSASATFTPTTPAATPTPTAATLAPASPTGTPTRTRRATDTPTQTPTPGFWDPLEAPPVMNIIKDGPDAGKSVITDLATGTSRFATGLFPCFPTLTRDFIYRDNCSTFSEILQVDPNTGAVVKRQRSPIQTKAMVASPDERWLVVAWQDCPSLSCNFPSDIDVYRIPEFEWDSGFGVQGTVCHMLFVGQTLLIVSEPPDERSWRREDGRAFVITLVRPTDEAPAHRWPRVERIIRGDLRYLFIRGLGWIQAFGQCRDPVRD
ncbi:MAG: hypothetical protein KatS3mg077_3196 [Candidatus Binatia bacterium]|nr:MAG: hypothetical protein KatS3mg077_3196 [Candidatus Binatia bacterium]